MFFWWANNLPCRINVFGSWPFPIQAITDLNMITVIVTPCIFTINCCDSQMKDTKSSQCFYGYFFFFLNLNSSLNLNVEISLIEDVLEFKGLESGKRNLWFFIV